jgi:hypothetical protein
VAFLNSMLMLSTPESTIPLDIDHPMQPGWIEAGLDIMDEPRPRQVITERFGETYPNLQGLLRAIGDASRQLDSVRQIHERWNTQKLKIGAIALGGAHAQEYNGSMCDPERIGNRILWFAKLTTALYTRFDSLQTHDEERLKSLTQSVNGVEHFRKIAIDIWGKRQGGIWDSTADMDKAAKTIPDKVLELAPDAGIQSRGEIDDDISYTFHPVGVQYGGKAGNPTADFKTGTVRRRRTEHIIRIPGSKEVSVIKESYGLILLDEMRDEESADYRRAILESYRKPSEDNFKVNSDPARAAGSVFEQGIIDRHKTRKVVPLGAHYYMATGWGRELTPKV